MAVVEMKGTMIVSEEMAGLIITTTVDIRDGIKGGCRDKEYAGTQCK